MELYSGSLNEDNPIPTRMIKDHNDDLPVVGSEIEALSIAEQNFLGLTFDFPQAPFPVKNCRADTRPQVVFVASSKLSK